MTAKRYLTIGGSLLLAIAAILVVSPLTIYCPESKLVSERKTFHPSDGLVVAEFPVHWTRPCLLKIKHVSDRPLKATYKINDMTVPPDGIYHFRIREDSTTAYIRVTREMIGNSDTATIEASFGPTTPREVTIQFSNYRKKLRAGLYVVFSNTDYSVAATPRFFKWLAAMAVIAFIACYLLSSASGRTDRLITLKVLSPSPWNPGSILLCLGLLVATDILVYWHSLGHIFRHDEWFFLFSTRNQVPDFKFFLEHIDWQLKLPYDRLMFRPIHHGMLALNRWMFDTSYVGPHILTLGKHIVSACCFWWVLNEFNRNRSSFLFALLFSVLTINIDPVIWPHIDAYIVTTIFTLVSIVFFRRTLDGRIGPCKGSVITSVILLANLLTTEIAFFLPFVFFVLYWLVFRKAQSDRKAMNRAVWLVAIVPYGVWGVLFAVHLACAWPDLNMSAQSSSVGVFTSLTNIFRLIIVITVAIISPVSQVSYGDKIYYSVATPGYVLALIVLLVALGRRKQMFRLWPRQSLLILCSMLAIAAIICLGRASYVQSILRTGHMVCHYSYCLSALVLAMIYCAVDFKALAATARLKRFVLLAIIVLIVINSVNTEHVTVDVGRQLQPLKNYCSAVGDFVSAHKNEPGFSFKAIDRPPEIQPFNWYSQTCIEGLFNRYINLENPAYILGYDYDSHKIESSRPDRPAKAAPLEDSYSPPRGDFTDDHGISFNNMRIDGKTLQVGVSEVTQRQWAAVMGTNPSRFQGDDYPVENVSFTMVQQFIAKLNKGSARARYRLPTLAEYNLLIDMESTELSRIKRRFADCSWTRETADGRTHPVGDAEPTQDGIYDFIGNVWEWTSTPIHLGSPTEDYKDNPRMCFGLSWRDSLKKAESLVTDYMPEFRYENLGLRLIRVPADTTSSNEH